MGLANVSHTRTAPCSNHVPRAATFQGCVTYEAHGLVRTTWSLEGVLRGFSDGAKPGPATICKCVRVHVRLGRTDGLPEIMHGCFADVDTRSRIRDASG